MKKLNIAMLILTALSITACGSSGSPSNSTATNQEKVQQNTPYSQEGTTVGGGVLVKDGEMSFITLELSEIHDIVKDNLEDRKRNGLSSCTDGIPAQCFHSDAAQDTAFTLNTTIGYRGRYTTVGRNPTQDMPISNIFNYKGKGISYFDNNSGGSYWHDTNVTLTADFTNKTLTGSITGQNQDSKLIPVEISADITKNTFTGEKNGVSVRGGFFGNNANELIGDYIRKETQNSAGIFQATKQ